MKIIRAGVLTTVQDYGRVGLQHLGVQSGGAMDQIAYRVGNALVGNESGAASLECTLDGPTIDFAEDAVIALTGADCEAMLGEIEIPDLRPVWLRAGVQLRIGAMRRGARTYLAVRGGIDVPICLGSRSTDLRNRLGGLQGRALKRGDLLAIGLQPQGTPGWPITGECCWAPWSVRDPLGPSQFPARVHFVPGRHWEQFSGDSRRQFVAQPYRVSAQSDRMGYRLQGPRVQLETAGDRLSEPVAWGSIQVPPDGQPIVLLADRQTMGGYPCIGEVSAVDLALFAQMKPGDEILFDAISHSQSEQMLLTREQELARLLASARARWGR